MSFFLTILTVTVYYQYAFINNSFGGRLTNFDELIVIIILISVIASKINQGNFKINKTPLDKPIIFFALLFLLSNLINSAPIVPLLWSIKNFFLYVVLYYCITSCNINLNTMSKVAKVVITLFIIQIPIVFYDVFYSTFNSGGIGSLEADSIRGLINDANVLSASTLTPLFLYLGFYRFKIKSFISTVIIFGLLFVLISGAGRFAILLFIFSIIYIFSIKKKIKIPGQNLSKIQLFLILLSFSILIGGYYLISKENIINNYNIWWLLTQGEFDIHSGSQRLLYYPLTFKILLEAGILNIIFGFGPGMFASDAGMRLETPWSEYLGNVFGQVDAGFDPYVSSQIIPIWGELGLVGLIIFFWLLFRVLKIAKKVYSKSNDIVINALSVSLITSCLLMIIGSFVHNYYEMQVIQYPFWLFTGFIVNIMRNQKIK